MPSQGQIDSHLSADFYFFWGSVLQVHSRFCLLQEHFSLPLRFSVHLLFTSPFLYISWLTSQGQISVFLSGGLLALRGHTSATLAPTLPAALGLSLLLSEACGAGSCFPSALSELFLKEPQLVLWFFWGSPLLLLSFLISSLSDTPSSRGCFRSIPGTGLSFGAAVRLGSVRGGSVPRSEPSSEPVPQRWAVSESQQL